MAEKQPVGKVLSDRFAQLVVDRMPAALAVYDRQGRLVYSNPIARHILGLDEREMSSRTTSDPRWQTIREDGTLFPAEEYPVNVTLRTGEPQKEVVMGVLRPDHTYSWLVINSEPLFDEGPERPSGVVAIFLDVTDRVQLRKQLFESQKLDAIGKLSGGVAHDLRNILQAITTSSEVIGRSTLDERARKQVEVIRTATRRGSDLTQQLFAVARRRDVEPKPLDLTATITASAELLQPVLGGRIRLMTSCAKDLWKIHADAGLISQIIMNLVLNARDAMPSGGTVEIGATNFAADEALGRRQIDYPQAQSVLLSVNDTGSGIPPDIIDKIFDPYFTTKSEQGGHAGLGLAVVHGIVQQQRGKIWVNSMPGIGTSFKIAFPRYVG